MSSCKLSIIIPVYNAERYIKRCVKSITSQKIDDLEILLVNDASTDNSLTECYSLSKADSRIRVLNNDANGGASVARNIGINCALGEYIAFVDSDDFWIKDVRIKEYLKLLDSHPAIDMLMFQMESFFPSSNKMVRSGSFPSIACELESDKWQKSFSVLNSGVFPNSPCNKIIRASFIHDNSLFFTEGTTGEDILWYFDAVESSDNFLCVNQSYYVYDHSNEYSVTKQRAPISLPRIIFSISDKYKFESSPIARLALGYMAYEYIILLCSLEDYPNEIRDKAKDYIWLLDYEDNRKVKLSKRLFSVFGMKLGIKVLQVYRDVIRKYFAV